MIQPLRYATAFDMDGVIFRTTKPKHDARLSLFPETMKEVASDAIMGLSGVPRRHKLARVYETCFRREPSTTELQNYLANYEVALRAVLEAPVVAPGIRTFLERLSSPRFVCSSAPLEEVNHQLPMAGLEQHFDGTYGAPISKLQALRDVARRVRGMKVVFFGDATIDRDAARLAGCGFVAVVGETDQFSGTTTPKISDFANDEVVLEAIKCALVANAASRSGSQNRRPAPDCTSPESSEVPASEEHDRGNR